jgi:hypothetical protein
LFVLVPASARFAKPVVTWVITASGIVTPALWSLQHKLRAFSKLVYGNNTSTIAPVNSGQYPFHHLTLVNHAAFV